MAMKWTRREILKLSVAAAAGAMLAGCAPAQTLSPTQVSPPEEKSVAPTEAPPQGKAEQEVTVETPPAPQPVVGTELLKLRATTYWLYSEPAANNANDVVTPYFEKLFNVEFEMIASLPGRTAEEEYALHKAADTVPEIMSPGGRLGAQKLALTGDFADMTDHLPAMPNYTRYIHEPTWPRFENNGRHYVLPHLGVNGLDPRFQDDVFWRGFGVWPLLAREDILAKCGYKFTPLDEIAVDTTAKGIWPTLDQLAIEPAIDTPAEFDELLRKIRALDIQVGARPLYPINSIYWSVFHISSQMDNGHWRVNDEGEVDGYLGLPGAYPWYKMWSQWYQDDLLDPEYVIQKNDQLQTSWAMGRAAVGLMVPDLPAARQALRAQDPTAVVRPIPWPKEDERYGFFDIFECGFTCSLFSKKLGDNITRLVELTDYLSSDEGQEIVCWGPPDAGLYVTGTDGRKQWKDEETRKNIMDNISETQNADYYGLWHPASNKASRVSWAMPHCTPVEADYRKNYPPELQIEIVVPRVFSMDLNCSYNTDGRVTYGDGGGNCEDVNAYYWNSFVNDQISRLLEAKDEGAFDAAWEGIMETFIAEGNYAAAKADVAKWFAEYAPEALRSKVQV